MLRGFVVALVLLAAFGGNQARAADYEIDPAHTGITFKISHLGLSWTFGHFNDFSGSFTLDTEAPAKSSFAMTIKTDSIDTGNKKRNAHLGTPDFFDTKQFPTMTFKSTSVKPIENGYEVVGDFTMHGVTKSISFPLQGGRTAEFPKGVQRVGFTTELKILRADYGMDKMLDAIGKEVHIAVSFEGVKK